MKKCCKCKNLKPVLEFSKNRSAKDGFYHYCKACISQINKEKRLKDPSILEKERLYKLNNKDKVKTWNKRYRGKHIEENKMRNKVF